MTIEGVGRYATEGTIELRRDEPVRALVCRGAEAFASAERALRRPGGGAPGARNDIVAALPVVRIVRHGREILEAACLDETEQKVGKKTAQAIAGSVTEEITRGLVITATVLGVGGAVASGGSAVLIGCLGTAGYVILPSLARTGAEWLIEQVGLASRRLGAELKDHFRRASN